MKKRQLAALAAALVATAMTATACGGGGAESGSATSGTITVDWEPSYKPGMDYLVKEFEKKYPDAKVNVKFTPPGQRFSLIRTQLQAGTAPDIFWTTPGDGSPFSMEVLHKAGYLADLSASPWSGKLRPEIKKYGESGGKTYSLQTDIDAYGVLYNDQAMKKAGLTAPTTWDGVLQFCQDARDKGVSAYALGAQDQFTTQQFIYSVVPTLVYKADPEVDAEFKSGDTTFASSPGWQETMDKYKQALDAGCFNDRPAGTSFETSFTNLATGKSLGLIGTYLFSAPATAVNPKATFSFDAFPVAEDPWMMIGAFGGAGVNAKAKNLPLAKTFVNFLAQPDIMRGYSDQGTGSLPTILGDKPYKPKQPALQVMEKYLDGGKASGFVDQTWPNADIQAAMYQTTQSMLAGKASPDDVLKAMSAKY